MQYKFCPLIVSAIMTIAGALSLNATDTKVVAPAAHQAEHSDLIAGQLNIGNQIKVEDTEAFLGNLFPEEEEPDGTATE